MSTGSNVNFKSCGCECRCEERILERGEPFVRVKFGNMFKVLDYKQFNLLEQFEESIKFHEIVRMVQLSEELLSHGVVSYLGQLVGKWEINQEDRQKLSEFRSNKEMGWSESKLGDV